MAASMNEEMLTEKDNFKDVYKKYKRRDRRLDVSDVIDLNKNANLTNVS